MLQEKIRALKEQMTEMGVDNESESSDREPKFYGVKNISASSLGSVEDAVEHEQGPKFLSPRQSANRGRNLFKVNKAQTFHSM